jgi:hypothetical protein
METVQGVAERERLRPFRVKNYAVKRAADFQCSHDGCEVDHRILVVEIDGELTTRCQGHLNGVVQPGQWGSD